MPFYVADCGTDVIIQEKIIQFSKNYLEWNLSVERRNMDGLGLFPLMQRRLRWEGLGEEIHDERHNRKSAPLKLLSMY